MEAEEPLFLPAQMWRDDVGNVDIVDATEEGCSNDHQYKHESKKTPKQNHIFIGSVEFYLRQKTRGPTSLPHHVINHLPYGDLKRSQRLMGWQDVRQACEAQHAGHCKQHLRNQLGVLLMPVLTYCKTGPHSQTDHLNLDLLRSPPILIDE